MFSFVKKLFGKKEKNGILSIIITENEIEIEINEITRKEKSTITFNKNEIEIGNDNGINIFTTNEYKIEYQNKTYQLRKEEIIGLYFYQFKRQIEKEYIIKEINIITNECTIEYQQKEYQLRKEEIKGLYFYQFKRQIEKNIYIKQIYHETHV